MIDSFQFSSLPEIIFGKGKRNELPAAVNSIGKKVLLLTGSSSIHNSGHGEEIISDWYLAFYSEWLPESGYELIPGYHFQYYDRRFKGLDQIEDSTLDVYIPIKAASSTAAGTHER